MVDVVIVGAGPAGVLLAHRFREHGIPHLLLERGKVAQSWRDMRPGMVLLSPGVPGTDWTSLTLQRPIWASPGVRRPFPSREDFLCYVEAFARDQRIAVTERVEVTGALRTETGFTVTTSEGSRIPCRFLMLATGGCSVPHYPDIPGISGNPHVLHSGDFLNCTAYNGCRVLVIGGGNSAAELCIELAGTAKTTMCTRGPLRYFSETGELDHIRGSSEGVLKEMFRFRIVSLREADPVVALSGGTATFGSGVRETFDWIVCATGYRPRWIPVDGGTVDVRGDGFPVISPVGESTVPGLYFAGSLAMFHRRCAFIHGFRNYVEKMFWDVADRL